MSLDTLQLASSATPAAAIRELHAHCVHVATRKYLLNTIFLQEMAGMLERVFDNRARPCLLCCDLMAFDLLQPPTQAQAATSQARAKPATEPGSLFAAVFRAVSFPPNFRAHVGLLPAPLQRMIHSLPPQALPPWFRQRVVIGTRTAVAPGSTTTRPAIEQLELSLYEYVFLAAAHFVVQGEVQVQTASSTNPRVKQPAQPPTPDQTTDAFLRLIANWLMFFVPKGHNGHSSSLKLEENGWNATSILAQGAMLMELLAEVWMGQFSYESAQALVAPTAAGASSFFPQLPAGLGGFPQPDEHTLPSRRIVLAVQTLVYHCLDLPHIESPSTEARLTEISSSRATILAYQQEKHSLHASSPMVKHRVDWHFFGMLSHCFSRWASEWSTNVGLQAVPLVSVEGSVVAASSQANRLDDRFTKLIELYLDYLEPWRTYAEPFSPVAWRWWIVANLPFYTVLLRDLMRLLLRIDIGREKSSARVQHLKTLLHTLKIFDGLVLEHVQDIEALLFKNPAVTQHGASRADPASQQLQQETFVARNALFHLAGLRPETYVPVFPSSVPLPLTPSTPAKSQSSFSAGFNSPSHGGGASRFASPSSPRNGSQLGDKSLSSADQKAPRNESQHVALELIQNLSVGYSSADALTAAREKELLEAPSAPATPRYGEPVPALPISLLAQEEQLGCFIEKRLRKIFTLPEETERRPVQQAARVEVDPAAAALAAPPRTLRALEPDREGRDPFLRLTAAGREQIRSGLRLCNRRDVPMLGDERPLCSYEYETLVIWSEWASQWLNTRFQLPSSEKGFKFDLRFMASQYFWNWLGGLILAVFVIMQLL